MPEDAPDPTAGRTAQRVRERPDIPRPLTDPTDPRSGEAPPRDEGLVIDDPTSSEPGA